MDKISVLDLTPGQLMGHIQKLGATEYRFKQVLDWVYKKKAAEFSEFSNLPKDFRNVLKDNFYLRTLTLKKKNTSSLDGTVRYTFKTGDGFEIPSVFLPSRNRNSVCISTQIGCPVKCVFCASGKVKFKRNLTRGEILEQIMCICGYKGSVIDGVLLMGMGEPLLNFENVASALQSMIDPDQFGFGRRRVTVSTVGYTQQIKMLSKKRFGVKLAVSLHASDDEIRGMIVPETVPYSVEQIIRAGIEYSRENKAKLTVEYVMIGGLNDTLLSAQKLVKLLDKTSADEDEIQVNLIPYNPSGEKEITKPVAGVVQNFRDFLIKSGYLSTIRESKGLDIGSACGQLS